MSRDSGTGLWHKSRSLRLLFVVALACLQSTGLAYQPWRIHIHNLKANKIRHCTRVCARTDQERVDWLLDRVANRSKAGRGRPRTYGERSEPTWVKVLRRFFDWFVFRGLPMEEYFSDVDIDNAVSVQELRDSGFMEDIRRLKTNNLDDWIDVERLKHIERMNGEEFREIAEQTGADLRAMSRSELPLDPAEVIPQLEQHLVNLQEEIGVIDVAMQALELESTDAEPQPKYLELSERRRELEKQKEFAQIAYVTWSSV